MIPTFSTYILCFGRILKNILLYYPIEYPQIYLHYGYKWMPALKKYGNSLVLVEHDELKCVTVATKSVFLKVFDFVGV